jgi:hypothetical protein
MYVSSRRSGAGCEVAYSNLNEPAAARYLIFSVFVFALCERENENDRVWLPISFFVLAEREKR